MCPVALHSPLSQDCLELSAPRAAAAGAEGKSDGKSDGKQGGGGGGGASLDLVINSGQLERTIIDLTSGRTAQTLIGERAYDVRVALLCRLSDLNVCALAFGCAGCSRVR